MLRVTPIYGSRWSEDGAAEEPSCTLVEYGGCRVLWNVGWWASSDNNNSDDEPFPQLPDHDCLIITDSTLQAAGGLPMYYRAMNEIGYTPLIYATFPTVKMGPMTLYDQHAAISLDGGQPPYTLEDLDDVFAAVHSIKYSQAIAVAHPETFQPCLSITAHRAGHVVGGAFFVLQRLQDDTCVVLTSRYHIAKELHLDSSTLLKYGSTPDVLVTYPGGPAFRRLRGLAHPNKPGGATSSSAGQQPPLAPVLVTQAERNLVESVLSVLRRDGNVLLPVDASGRVLELVLLLNQQWERQRLTGAYNLCWLGPMVTNTIEFARSQLEWMATSLGHQFDSQGGHPYQLKAVRFCSNKRDLEAVMAENQNPTCVLASGLSLEGGPSRDVLLKWADNPDNAIIFTDSSQCCLRRRTTTSTPAAAAAAAAAADAAADQILDAEDGYERANVQPLPTVPVSDMGAPADAEQEEGADGVIGDIVGSAVAVCSKWTAAAQLLIAWSKAKYDGREMDDSVVIDVKVPHRAPLAGAELKAFLANEEEARLLQKKKEEKLAMLREVEIAKGQLRLGEQETVSSGGITETRTAAPSGSARPKKKSRFDSSLFLKFSKPLHLTFEVREEAVGLAQADSTAKYGIGESVGRSGEVLEDDYGIAVIPEKFSDIVSGVDPSKFAGGSGRIGEDVLRRGLGYAGMESRRPSTKVSSSSAALARVSEDEDQDDLDEMDEQAAVEAVDLSKGKGIVRGRNGRPPTKVTTVPRKVEVLAEISFVPLEGRVGARAARQSVRALQPRQVVVLGGPQIGEMDPSLTDEVTLLSNAAFSFATDKKPVCVPSDGETAELDIGHAAYDVRLIDAPYQTREEKESGKDPPLPVDNFEAKLGACDVSLLDCVATGQKVALDGSIVLAPRKSPSGDSPKIYLSDGEVLLTDLRAELIAAGMKAEYSAHTGYSQLVVNGKIVVKKAADSGEIGVEGPLCQDFYTVRSVVCGQFVTL